MSLVELSANRGVATITLGDVERRNVLSHQLLDELVAAIDRVEYDDGVRVVVLTNAGKVFCAGADLSERSADPGTGGRSFDLSELFGRIRGSAKPYVGRIAGHCVAGGVGLAAVVDIAVALDSATFGFTEVRVGVAPAMIAVVCLPKMRDADARAAFLRGRRFSAADAAAMGLISSVASVDDLDGAVDAVVTDLLAGGPAALAATKKLLRVLPTLDPAAAASWTAELSGRLFASDEAREGMSAYLEKRRPAWDRDNAGD